MRSSYDREEVELLLKDITGLVEPLPAQVRERNIQRGVHYCEMLPPEYKPSPEYMRAYQDALNNYAGATARAVGALAEKLYEKKGDSLTLVSLARAGIPIGILLRRYLRNKYQINIKHYAVSIIRGRGIDRNAVDYILQRHAAGSVRFVDGWTGKGAILGQLKAALEDYPQLSAELGVVSDPANLTALCGTHEDILIPSSCLNAAVTGLISRTFLRPDIIGGSDFHGAAYYAQLEPEDLSEQFLRRIEEEFDYGPPSRAETAPAGPAGPETVREIARRYGVGDVNFIKPGIGETTRVLLRRVPWKILVNEAFARDRALAHIYQLADEKNVPCEISKVGLGNYKACGIIRQLSDV